MKYIYDDGGRALAGFKGSAGDCVARAISIAGGMPYEQVYQSLAHGMGRERKSKGATARNGIHTSRKWFKEMMNAWGFVWTPTMFVGQGCKVHLHDGELPPGRLVVAVSNHYTAVIDGVVRDTHDPQREIAELGSYDPVARRNRVIAIRRRCVYGYWTLGGQS